MPKPNVLSSIMEEQYARKLSLEALTEHRNELTALFATLSETTKRSLSLESIYNDMTRIGLVSKQVALSMEELDPSLLPLPVNAYTVRPSAINYNLTEESLLDGIVKAGKVVLEILAKIISKILELFGIGQGQAKRNAAILKRATTSYQKYLDAREDARRLANAQNEVQRGYFKSLMGERSFENPLSMVASIDEISKGFEEAFAKYDERSTTPEIKRVHDAAAYFIYYAKERTDEILFDVQSVQHRLGIGVPFVLSIMEVQKKIDRARKDLYDTKDLRQRAAATARYESLLTELCRPINNAGKTTYRRINDIPTGFSKDLLEKFSARTGKLTSIRDIGETADAAFRRCRDELPTLYNEMANITIRNAQANVRQLENWENEPLRRLTHCEAILNESISFGVVVFDSYNTSVANLGKLYDAYNSLVEALKELKDV